MKAHVSIVICVAIVLLCQGATEACAPVPPRYFDASTYMDPVFKTRGLSEIQRNRRKMFLQLVRQYVALTPDLLTANDSAARGLSRREEPESYAEYLTAAQLFHDMKYDPALRTFDSLRIATEPDPSLWERLFNITDYSWVHEASTYMVARCRLIISQDRYDGYWRAKELVDQDMLKQADSLYRQYLAEYPDGLYAHSARDIRRKIYYLSDQQALLDQELKELMLRHFPAGDVKLPDSMFRGPVDEFYWRFRGKVDFAHDSPILTAYALMGPDDPEADDLRALEARESNFAGYPGLFRYLRALALYRLGSFQELLEKTPAESPVQNTMWLSTQLLRARAMIGADDVRGARLALEHMYAMSPEMVLALELGILIIDRGDGLDLFRDSSPIADSSLLRGFAAYGLTGSALVVGLTDSDIPESKQDILRWELARRYALSERFRKLIDLLDGATLVPFTSAYTMFATLAEDPDDMEALVEFGEFLYKNHWTLRYSQSPITYGDVSRRCVLCKEFVTRSETYTTALTVFLTAEGIAQKSGKRSQAEAKALHYIVMSGKRGSWNLQMTCHLPPRDGTFEMTGKEAFARLHTVYKDSHWAKATPYYY